MRKSMEKHMRIQEKKKQEEIREKRGEIERLCPDCLAGLDEEQARARGEAGWSNEEVDASFLTVKDIVRKNVCTYFNLIFAVLAALVCITGSLRNLSFLPVVIINTVVGIVQEVRAKRVLEKMSMLHAPHAEVVREGKTRQVDSRQLVIDDIVIFRAGSQVCADAVICQGQVRVNESLLTGESEEIEKKEGDTLLSGSFITAGKCRARLDQVGADSYISRLTLQAKAMREGEQSEMIRSLNRLVKVAGIAVIPIGIALFSQSYFLNQETFRDSILSMVAAVIGMIPEGLYLLTTMALTVGTVRLARKKVLLHDMKSMETLARVDVLCVDKTGTITENEMEVKEVLWLEEDQEEETIRAQLSRFVASMDPENGTIRALQVGFPEKGAGKPGTVIPGKGAEAVIPFSSAAKYSGAVLDGICFVLGAPEFVLLEQYEEYRERLEAYSAKGCRVLVFGTCPERPDGKPLQTAVCPLAAVILQNRVRKEARQTFAYFAQQGVEIKVISGDNPLTVSETAKEAGIADADRYVDARQLKTEEEVEKAAMQYTVFGRVLPEQKRLLVRALKKNGKTVAMTGDGVNDVLALKDADCSIAMASGSEAAIQASQVVLLESDFSRMPEVVGEGRRVVNNIQQSASLFLVKNIFSFLLSLASLCFVFQYPLEPAQISLISMFTIGIPGFFLSLQPNLERIRGRFLSNVLLKALPAGITDAALVAFLTLCGEAFHIGGSDISTAATLLLAVVGFMILYQICRPMNLIRRLIWWGCAAGLAGSVLLVPWLFSIGPLSRQGVMLLVLFILASEPVFRYLTQFNEWLQRLFRKLAQKVFYRNVCAK